MAFTGDGWTPATIHTVVSDLRADLAARQIDLELVGEQPRATQVPIARIGIATEGRDAVVIQVDVADGGSTRRLTRTTHLDAVPKDGRALAIALTADELLRVGWVQIALQRAADKAPSAASQTAPPPNPPRPAQAPPPNPPRPSQALAPPPPNRASESSPTAPKRIPPPQFPAPPATVSQASTPASDKLPPQAQVPPVPKPSPEPQAETSSPAAIAAVSVGNPAPPARLQFGVSSGAAVWAAPPNGTNNVPVSAGIASRFALTGERLGGSVGAVLPTQATLDLGGATAKDRRIAFDAGPRLVWRRPVVGLATDLGLLLVWHRIDGASLMRNSGATALSVGVRGGLTISFGHTRVTPWLGLAAELVPVPPSISFVPAGTAGHEPAFWVGLLAGLRLGVVGNSSGP